MPSSWRTVALSREMRIRTSRRRQPAARQAQEAAWDLVWQRRAVYFATVAASLYLLVQPLRAPVPEGQAIDLGVVARLLGFVASLLPSLVAPWIRSAGASR